MYIIKRGTQIVVGSNDYNKVLAISEGLTARKIKHSILYRESRT